MRTLIIICLIISACGFFSCSTTNETPMRESITVVIDYIETQNNKDFKSYIKLFHPENEDYSTGYSKLFDDYPEVELKSIKMLELSENEAVMELAIISIWDNVKKKTFSDTKTLSLCIFNLQRDSSGDFKIFTIEWQEAK